MLFVRGSGNCVQCNTPLRKSNFRVQLFEDPAIDKEVEIRKKVLKMCVEKMYLHARPKMWLLCDIKNVFFLLHLSVIIRGN